MISAGLPELCRSSQAALEWMVLGNFILSLYIINTVELFQTKRIFQQTRSRIHPIRHNKSLVAIIRLDLKVNNTISHFIINFQFVSKTLAPANPCALPIGQT